MQASGLMPPVVSAPTIAAAGLALPFVLALPAHYEPAHPGWTIALCALVAGVFWATRFAARQLSVAPDARRFVLAFAAVNAVGGLLGFMSNEQYRLAQPLTDLALLYLVFLGAALAGAIRRPLGRLVLAPLVLLFGVMAIIRALHVDTFGFPIGPDGYRAILQSNPGEALEFMGSHLGFAGIMIALLAFAVSVAVAFGVATPRAPRQALGWSTVFALPLFALLAAHAALVTPRFEGLAEAATYAAEIMEHRAVRQARRAEPPAVALAQTAPLAGREQTYVFVVGESLTRNHMSLYGYWRDTTPQLRRLAAELVAFRDVISPHSHTDQSLELVLTLASQDNGLRFTDAHNFSMLELLRAAGFATWWISNQNTFGPWDNKVAVLARAAQHVHYAGRASGTIIAGPHDDALLGPFAAALRDDAPRKAIFLHFLGNHWEYARRYPAQAARFRKHPSAAEIGALADEHPRPQLVNEYDDAVRYHDYLLGQVVEMLRATQRPSALVMFSDHGESVYGLKGHYWRQFTRDHVEVPLAIWFSPEYVGLAGDAVQRARLNAGRPFALEDLPHLVAGLAALHSPLFDERRSPLSPAYQAPRTRRLFEGEQVYEEVDEPSLNARHQLVRLAGMHPALERTVWAHRVNTIGKLMQAARLFAGVEIDVFYDSRGDSLLVNHPPEPPSGLTLDQLLGYANRIEPRLGLWLDLKNLNEANGARILRHLERLDARHGLRARALVETDHTGPAAAAIRAAGFRSSYYLPTSLLVQNAGGAAGFSCYGAAEIRRTVAARRFAAVSYDWRGQHWVERCLGAFLRERRLPSHVWDLEPVLSEPGARDLLTPERAQAYASAATVLLPFRSLFDDRR